MRNWGLLVNIWQEVRWPDDLMFVRLHFPYICGYRTKRQKNTFLNVFFLSRSTAIFSFICCICTFELELHLSCNCTCDQKDTFSVPHKVWKGTVCQMPTFCQLTKKSPSFCPATVDLIICVIQLFFERSSSSSSWAAPASLFGKISCFKDAAGICCVVVHRGRAKILNLLKNSDYSLFEILILLEHSDYS